MKMPGPDIIFRPATMADAAEMAPQLRPSDQAELAALSNRSHAATLRLSVSVSDRPMAITQGDDLVALFGVGRGAILSSHGVPWLLGTHHVDRLVRPLLPLSRAVVRHWRSQYPLLINHVSARHHQSIRWLKWLGFTLHPAAPYGPFGNPFHKFEMRS